jgi:D-arabinonate dehydratase
MYTRIKRIDVWTLRIPLPHVVFLGEIRIAEREYAVAVIETEDGTRGWGYTLTRGAPIEVVARHCFVSLLENENAVEVERLSQKMFDAAYMFGAEGIAARAISILDIALWDIKAKCANISLSRLIVEERIAGDEKAGKVLPDRLPILVPCGYRREKDGDYSLLKELAFYRDAGVRNLKTMLFPMQAQTSADILVQARKMLGDDTVLGNDFFARAQDAPELLRVLETLEDARLDFIEDPFPLTERKAFRKLRDCFAGQIITGETVSSEIIADTLMESGCVSAVRWDATMCGGITRWLRMQKTAEILGLDVWPHVMPEIHIHLAAATGQPYVEMPLPEFNTMAFDSVLRNPLVAHEGCCLVPTETGLGIELDENRAQEFRI